MTHADAERVCADAGVEPMHPDPADVVGLSRTAGRIDLPLHGARLNPSPGASGWFIWRGEHSDDEDFYRPVCIAHLSSTCPQALPFLSLPPGWRFYREGDFVDVWFDAEIDLGEPGEAETGDAAARGANPPAPLVWGFNAPQLVLELGSTSPKGLLLTEEHCALVVDGRVHCFVRVRLNLPVEGSPTPFTWLTWAAVSDRDFEHSMDSLAREGREADAAYRGTLANHLPYATPTLGLTLRVEHQPVGLRPLARLEDASHPIVREQRLGITPDRVREFERQLTSH
ncbi:MAG: DUF2199 domain-containing protein [Myxococcota bacterium]